MSCAAERKFEPVPISVPIEVSVVDIGPYPTTVRTILGRGDWPHHNIVFPLRDLASIFRSIDIRLRTAYNSISVELEMCRYLGVAPSPELLAAHRSQLRRAAIRRWLLDWWYRPRPRRL